MQITYEKTDKLVPYSNNARKHPKKQLQKLAASIENFGFLVPILIDQNKTILAGHARAEAAKLALLEEIPTILADHLSENQKRAFILADNRISQDASWDMDKLKHELEFLSDFDLEMDLTGFETTEIDIILEDSQPPEDEIEEPPENYQPISKIGDVWELGNHRLICGSALNAETYQELLRGEKVQMVFTDPPYNVAINGHVKRDKNNNAREFAMASEEMTESEFTSFLSSFIKPASSHAIDGAILYICMDWRHIQELQAAAKGMLELKQLCVWSKDNAGMGSFYRSQHELIFVFKHGKKPHINNFGLGAKGRYRTNVWDYPMVRKYDQPDLENIFHPTVKPTALVMDAVLDCSRRKGIILDPFGGSGTTLIAAEKTGRRARLIDLDPIYCDMIVKRWEKLTGKKARHKRIGKIA